MEVAPSSVVSEPVSLPCLRCKTPVIQNPASLVAGDKAGVIATACPACKRAPAANAQTMGCHHCGRKLSASAALVASGFDCPWCGQELSMPSESERQALTADGKAFKWLIFRNGSMLRHFESKDALTAAMTSGEVRADDVCMIHRSAEPVSLRKACDTEGSLRPLYDPIGAKATQVMGVAFAVGAVLYLLADFYVFGWRQSVVFVAAIACVTLLKDRFWVGFIALFVLGKVLDVPVGGGTFFSLLVEAFFTALVGGGVAGIAYGATYLAGRIARWDRQASVWRVATPS